jgi:hypothetical protein
VAPLDPGLLRDALAGDPLAQVLITIIDRLEVAEKRSGVSAENLQHIAYEAAAGARTEAHKLVQIETDRRWYRSAVLALAGVVLGYAACWLTHWMVP